MRELKLAGLEAYRAHLLAHPDEWRVLENNCHITISRFFRDRAVFDHLTHTALPRLASDCIRRGTPALRCWSAGCGAGEEPYTLSIQWHFALRQRFPTLEFEVVATDADTHQLTRARAGRYRQSSLREVPESWRAAAFVREPNDEYRIVDELRRCVTLHQQDLRRGVPTGPFSLILCRNLAFSYFDEAEQRRIATVFAEHLVSGGVLVVGKGEEPPWVGALYRKLGDNLFEKHEGQNARV